MDSNKNIWIDRQEYDRLKALESQPYTAPAGGANGTTTVSAPYANTNPISSTSKLTILTAIFAIFSFTFPPAIIVFLGLGLVSLGKFFASGASRKAKVGVVLTLGIGIALLIAVLGPFLLIFAVLIMWQIGCMTGLGGCTSA